MAGDLIPPPSPAGKPVPEGTRSDFRETPARERGLSDDVLLGLPPDPAGEAPPAEPVVLPESPYRSRFGFITGALIGVAMAALVIVVLVASGSDDGAAGGTGARWSQWQPTASDPYSAVAQIAQHVAFEYRLDDGSQIVSVESGPIKVNDIPLQVVVKTAPQGGDIIPINGNGVWFVLDGLGTGGAIASGTPSNARGALVRREALELALYTFHYVTAFDHVVVLLPPPPPDKSVASSTTTTSPDLTALLFRPGDLRPQLQVPLDLTLSPRTPRPATITAREQAQLIEFLAQNTFNTNVGSSQVGAGFLVLTHPQTAVTTQLQSLLPSGPSGASGATGPTGPTGSRLTKKKPRAAAHGGSAPSRP